MFRYVWHATIIDGDARSRALRGLANGDNGTCLFGGPIHGNNAIMIDIPLCFVCGFVGATHASPVMGRW